MVLGVEVRANACICVAYWLPAENGDTGVAATEDLIEISDIGLLRGHR